MVSGNSPDRGCCRGARAGGRKSRQENRDQGHGVTDILIAVVDGLKGFPEAINAVFPQTVVQTCIVHLIRHSMDFAAWKDRKGVAQALKTVYRAVDANAGQAALDRRRTLGRKISRHRPELVPQLESRHPVFCVPGGGPADHYTTNAIEALNSKISGLFTMAADRIRALTTPHQIKPISTSRHSAWRLNPGRRSTCRRGDSVQTHGAGSIGRLEDCAMQGRTNCVTVKMPAR